MSISDTAFKKILLAYSLPVRVTWKFEFMRTHCELVYIWNEVPNRLDSTFREHIIITMSDVSVSDDIQTSCRKRMMERESLPLYMLFQNMKKLKIIYFKNYTLYIFMYVSI